MGNKPGAATIALTGFGRKDAHGLAVELELHFRLWQQTRPLADFGRNSHPTFGYDAHGHILTLTCKSEEFGVEVRFSVIPLIDPDCLLQLGCTLACRFSMQGTGTG